VSSTLFLASVQIQKDLIGGENKLILIERWLVNDKGAPQDLDCYRTLVVLREVLKSLD